MEYTNATESERVCLGLRTSSNLQQLPMKESTRVSQTTNEAQILIPSNDNNMDHPDRLRQDLIALGIADFGLPLQQLVGLVRRRIPDIISESRRLGIFYAWLNNRLGMIDASNGEAFRSEIHAWCTTLAAKCGFEPKEILREYHAWKSEHTLLEPSSSRRLDLAHVEITSILKPHIRGPITPIQPACRLIYTDPPGGNTATEHGNMHPDRLMQTRDVIDVEEWERPIVEISSDDESVGDLSFLTGANALVRMGGRFDPAKRKRANKVIGDLDAHRAGSVIGKQSRLNREITTQHNVLENLNPSSRPVAIPAHRGYREQSLERSIPSKRSAAIRTSRTYAEKVSERPVRGKSKADTRSYVEKAPEGSAPGKPPAAISIPTKYLDKMPQKPIDDKGPEVISTPSNCTEKEPEETVPGKRLVGFSPLGPKPPDGYICKRCTRPGHFIRFCPTNSDHTFDRPPPPDYLCKICKRPGHYIVVCPQNPKHRDSIYVKRILEWCNGVSWENLSPKSREKYRDRNYMGELIDRERSWSPEDWVGRSASASPSLRTGRRQRSSAKDRRERSRSRRPEPLRGKSPAPDTRSRKRTFKAGQRRSSPRRDHWAPSKLNLRPRAGSRDGRLSAYEEDSADTPMGSQDCRQQEDGFGPSLEFQDWLNQYSASEGFRTKWDRFEREGCPQSVYDAFEKHSMGQVAGVVGKNGQKEELVAPPIELGVSQKSLHREPPYNPKIMELLGNKQNVWIRECKRACSWDLWDDERKGEHGARDDQVSVQDTRMTLVAEEEQNSSQHSTSLPKSGWRTPTPQPSHFPGKLIGYVRGGSPPNLTHDNANFIVKGGRIPIIDLSEEDDWPGRILKEIVDSVSPVDNGPPNGGVFPLPARL